MPAVIIQLIASHPMEQPALATAPAYLLTQILVVILTGAITLFGVIVIIAQIARLVIIALPFNALIYQELAT
jgi:hypothetical protein